MKVILIQDVPNLGQAGDIKNVSDGHARNFLIPRGLVRSATTGEVKQLDQYKRAAAKQATRSLENAKSLAEQISQITLTFKAHAGEGTKLYGSITTSEIADKLSEALGKEFDRRKIHLDAPLRQLGVHRVPIRLTADIIPELTVIVERDEGAGAD
ncbi:MAG: 50S ribosomal protein L9 [Anaerolineae bacterium]|nr:50S ribosomal protein L9 [Anaerolineae bacterium]